MPGVGGFYCEGLHHPITTTLLLLIVTGKSALLDHSKLTHQVSFATYTSEI